MTVHSNSEVRIPYPDSSANQLHLADVTGEGLASWVAYASSARIFSHDIHAGFAIVVARPNFPVTKLLTYIESGPEAGSPTAQGLITGFFVDPTKESILIFVTPQGGTAVPEVRAYDVNSDRSSLERWMTQPLYDAGNFSFVPPAIKGAIAGGTVQVLVGDFDGDGLDEILFYNRDTGVVRVQKYRVNEGFFPMPRLDYGNLSANPAALKNSVLWAGHFHEFDEEGRRDGLLVYNMSTGQIRSFDARRDPTSGGTVFWWGFDTGGLVAFKDRISVADVNGDGFDECVLYDIETGLVRFFRLELNRKTAFLKRLVCQEQGQIPVGKNYVAFGETKRPGVLIWAKMKRFPGEGGKTNARDDVFVYNREALTLTRCDARYDEGDEIQTFWFAFRQTAPDVMKLLFPSS
jgi:hypothetical protein